MWLASRGMGGESVSGYMRSAPGSTLSKIVVPSSNDFLVSFGTPSNAIRQRSSMVSRAVFKSSSGPQTIKRASSLSAFSSVAILFKSSWHEKVPNSSEWIIFGLSRQAITFSRSLNSFANIFPVWVK